MRDYKLTLDKFQKSNHRRRTTLAIRFGYAGIVALKQALVDGTFTITGNTKTGKGTTFSTYEEFNKLSGEVKRRLAKAAGYITTAAYMSKLRSKFGIGYSKIVDTVSVSNTKINDIWNIYILDESSSMRLKAASMFDGVRGSIYELKEYAKTTNNNIKVGISSFSNRIESFNINSVESVNTVNFTRTTIKGGATALNDAIGNVLNALENKPADTKVVVQIFTDGDENSSRTYDSIHIAEMIDKAEANNITVTFMGTAHDVNIATNLYSLREGNTVVHDNTSRGISNTFKMSARATVDFSKSISNEEDVKTSFYSKVLIKK